ncbi:MAG: DUF1848 family protein [Azospirillum sp.]|nr:DUF1848 family protein [Azospirillum sp.]
MIVSASYKTDIPAFFGDWFLNRLSAGWCRMVNPYGGQVHDIDLSPAAVDGFVFWTRNLGPFLPALDQVARYGFPFIVQMTVTGYPRVLERSVIDESRAVGQLRAVRNRYGPRVAVWRYDPIVLTSVTPSAWHIRSFARLAAALRGVVDEVVVSFLEPYRKTARNLDLAAGAGDFTWSLPDQAERQAMLARLAAIAGDHDLALTLCTQPALAGTAGIRPARCIDALRLSDVAGRPIDAPIKGNRPGCACHQSRDLGGYDSCPHGCVYCYAVSSRSAVRSRFERHDPNGPMLVPPRPVKVSP